MEKNPKASVSGIKIKKLKYFLVFSCIMENFLAGKIFFSFSGSVAIALIVGCQNFSSGKVTKAGSRFIN